MAETHLYDFEVLFHLEPTLATLPLPTRWWTGRGTLRLDAGDGNGEQSWLGGSFGDTQVLGVSAMEAVADGIPQRMGITIGLDETRDDIQHAVSGRDLGPVAAAIYFAYREAGTDAWGILSAGTEPKVIKGRSSQSTLENGVWAFEIENRVHDADRLLVDVWSDAAHRARNLGDRFFEFAASIEEGLDIDWPQ